MHGTDIIMGLGSVLYCIVALCYSLLYCILMIHFFCFLICLLNIVSDAVLHFIPTASNESLPCPQKARELVESSSSFQC